MQPQLTAQDPLPLEIESPVAASGYNYLVAGQSVSFLGTAITQLAVPALATLSLKASAEQIGLLLAAQRLPYPVLGPLIGVWVDRTSPKRLMVLADSSRAVLVGLTAAMAIAGWLNMGSLVGLTLLTAVFSVVFDVSYLAIVPALVGANKLTRANSILEVSRGFSSLVGPGIGGLLVQFVGSALAILGDALSFLASAVAVLFIRAPEVPQRENRQSVRADLIEGARHVFRNVVLRHVLWTMTLLTFLTQLLQPVMLIFAYRTLSLSPWEFGIVLSAGGIGAIGAGFWTSRLTAWLTPGYSLAATTVAVGLTAMAVSAAGGLHSPLLLLIPAELLNGAVGTANNIVQLTMRQMKTPRHLQGRMNSIYRTFYWAAWPLANIVGGVLAGALGAGQTILLSGCATTILGFVICLTPLTRDSSEPPGAPT